MTRDEILNAAKQCVCHDRNDQYGSPEDILRRLPIYGQPISTLAALYGRE